MKKKTKVKIAIILIVFAMIMVAVVQVKLMNPEMVNSKNIQLLNEQIVMWLNHIKWVFGLFVAGNVIDSVNKSVNYRSELDEEKRKT